MHQVYFQANILCAPLFCLCLFNGDEWPDDHPDIVVGEQVLEVGNGATAAEATVEVVTSGLEQTCKVGNNWKDLMHSLAMVKY